MTRSRDLANLGDNSSSLENQGLTLISTTTFSAVASHSVNNVFSATYTDYRIIVVGKNDTTDSGLNFRVRANGTDLTTSTYAFLNINADVSSGPSRDASYSNANVGLGEFNDNRAQCVIDISSPFLTERTTGTSRIASDTGATLNQVSNSFVVKNTTSYDGFTIYPGSGTITGTVSVYGYKK